MATAALAAPDFPADAQTILRERYLRRDQNGAVIEDPTGMLERVAAAIAAPGTAFGDDRGFWEARFFERLARFELLPNSPTLMNAGLPGGQLAACFVLPIDDDLDSISGAVAVVRRVLDGTVLTEVLPASRAALDTLGAVRDVFRLAHRLRLKGITVYRYGTRAGQTLSLVDSGTRRDCRECAE